MRSSSDVNSVNIKFKSVQWIIVATWEFDSAMIKTGLWLVSDPAT